VPILMYHSISDNLLGCRIPTTTSIHVPLFFAAQMHWLRAAGYRTVGLAEAWVGLRDGADLSRAVVLTFGDGYHDFYTDAIDVLTQCGFSATIFLVTDRIGQTATRVEGADCLTWQEVKILAQAGIRFGSHTVTHPDLRSTNPETVRIRIGAIERGYRAECRWTR